MAKILFFASLKDRMGVDKMEIPLAEPVTVRTLAQQAAREAGKEENVLLSGGVLFAVNQEMKKVDHLVNDGDELAALPPLSGGV